MPISEADALLLKSILAAINGVVRKLLWLQVMSENDSDSEEEDLAVLGGEGFTAEELARAEQQFSTHLVSSVTPIACYFSCCLSCQLIWCVSWLL